MNTRPIIAWGLVIGALRMLLHGLFWRQAYSAEYADPASVGYRAAIRLPIIGAIAFVPHVDETAASPVYDW